MRTDETSTEHRRLSFGAFGVHIDVEFPGDELRAPIEERLPPGWTRTEPRIPGRQYRIGLLESSVYDLRIDGAPPRQFTGVAELLDELEGDIQLHIAEFATPHLFVHAGVVCWNGSAILLPGRSHAGKSTLVTSLVQAGATYYSDEYAVLDAEGRVIPYPRRVTLRTGPHGPARRLDLTAHAPQGPDAAIPIPAGVVALLRYIPDGVWETATLSSMEGLMAISEQTVAIQRRPVDTMAILGRVAKNAQVIQGTRGEVNDAVHRLLNLVPVPC